MIQLCKKLLFSLDDGVGEIVRESCKKCGFEMDLSTADTHESDNGCVQVYAEADDFVFPMCSSEASLTKLLYNCIICVYISIYLNEAGSSSVHHINIHLYHF